MEEFNEVFLISRVLTRVTWSEIDTGNAVPVAIKSIGMTRLSKVYRISH